MRKSEAGRQVMTILFSHNNADLYGSSRSLLRLASRLVQDGHEVHVLLPVAGPLADALHGAEAHVHIMGAMAVLDRAAFAHVGGLCSFLIRLPLSVLRTRRVVKRVRPDIVHTNTSVVFASALASRASPAAHIWHIREFYSDFPGLWRWYQLLMGFCADRIVCVSQAVQRQFRPGVLEKTVVIHNGFPPEEFVPVAQNRIEAFKAQHNLQGFCLVGLIGRVILKRKGQDVFVRAASLLRDKFSRVRFVIVGSCYPGNEHHARELDRLIADLGVGEGVVQTGEATDIKAAYSALDISVVASATPEPFAGVTIESMAFGKPVIGTNTGGTPEQIIDGKTGILIPPDDPQSMADAIDCLLSDRERRLRMGQAARRHYEAQYTFDPKYAQLLSVYEDAANGRILSRDVPDKCGQAPD